ncbi:MAG: GNAT family N-acetyltransferase [Lachnospiraceae bacterium]|nr:GNAT family N-acetyltransferase [Lachnospiraceae bacterium]
MKIEAVTKADAAELLAIYAPYVTDTAVSFEYEVPSLEEFESRIESIASRLPYLKAVEDGRIIGYAYAAPFKGRKAYDWSAETTIYLRQDQRRKGTGRALYQQLEQLLQKIGIMNMNACIAVPGEESPRLTMDSILFHERMGFLPVGTFHNSGYKFDIWYDMMWMEKMLGQHKSPHPPVQFGQWRTYLEG